MIRVAVDKINMMAEWGSPRLGLNEVGFAEILIIIIIIIIMIIIKSLFIEDNILS